MASRKIAVALAGVSMVAALAAAGCSTLNHGTITGKQYEAPYTWTYWESVYCGKGCVTEFPIQEYQPAEYKLDLKSGKQTGSVDVPESTWDKAKIGEQYP